MSTFLHPDEALFAAKKVPPALCGCEHIAGTKRFLQKAFDLQREAALCFAITCDLEDGAPANGLVAHAEELLAVFASSHNEGKPAGLRLPHFTHPDWQTLLDMFIAEVGTVLAYITIPKLHTIKELERIVVAVSNSEKRLGVSNEIPLHILIETFPAFANIHEIAAHPRVECLDFGIMDFISEHLGVIPATCMRSPGQFEHALLQQAKSTLVHAATAHGCIASHNVTIAYSDTDQTYSDALRARDSFGFSRMWSIHPSQIEPIAKAMSPSVDDIQLAQEIVLAGSQAQWAPVSIDGTLYDRASYRYHWHTCKRARTAGCVLDDQFMKLFFAASATE